MPVVPKAVQDSLSSNPAKFTVAHRLLRENGFNHVVCAKNIADRSFKIFFVRNNKNNARLGIIAAKRILPGATDRNRVKRIIRETFRQHSIKQCKLDLVVQVKFTDIQEVSAKAYSLKMLFSRVEDRCAEL